MFNELVKGAIIAVFATLMLPQISTAQTETEAPVKKITEMLYPTVMVDLSMPKQVPALLFLVE